MSDKTILGLASAEASETGARQAACSYCCECGTYDAHMDSCLCCGFDFRSAPLEAPPAE